MTGPRKIPVGPPPGKPEEPEPPCTATEIEPVGEVDVPPAPPETPAPPAPAPADLEAVRRERDDLWDRLVRTQAEFENFRKRSRRERQEFEEAALARFLTDLLEIVDSFDRALETPEAAGQEGARSFREGMELVRKQVRDLLTREGVEEVPGAGAPFDPREHEAVAAEECEDRGAGLVSEVFRKGYRLRGRLLRAAQVKVCRAAEGGAGGGPGR